MCASLLCGCVCVGGVACCRMRLHGVVALYVVRVVVSPQKLKKNNNDIYIYIYIYGRTPFPGQQKERNAA